MSHESCKAGSGSEMKISIPALLADRFLTPANRASQHLSELPAGQPHHSEPRAKVFKQQENLQDWVCQPSRALL